MPRKAVLVSFLVLASAWLAAQDASAPATVPDRAAEAETRVRIAISSVEYPVTPGDVYRLVYRQSAGEAITRDLVVGGDYMVDLGVFGKIDAADLSFAEMKKSVEALIEESYARSLPSLTLLSTGVFRVGVRGEIARVEYPTAWGLTRLSEVVEATRGPYASVRAVEVAPRGREPRRYDLLRATRLGTADQDPLVKPGDLITLHLAQRIVRLAGEVRQPGSYELASEEGLRELIELYGGGLTERGEPARIRIDHATDRGARSDYVSIPQAYGAAPALKYGDAVTVSSKAERSPVVWFEGAVLPPAARPEGASEAAPGAAAGERIAFSGEDSHRRIACPILEGEMLSDALSSIRESIAPNANLASAALIRQGALSPIGVDMEKLLAGSDYSSDIPLAANDRIFIPILRSTVSVSGAVNSAGVYPYQPGMTALYYIGLAGGIDPERNGDGRFRLLDAQGKRRKSSAPILPGDQVFVPSNTLGYNAVRYFPLFTGVTTLALTLFLSFSF